jgi:hypothetical protein
MKLEREVRHKSEDIADDVLSETKCLAHQQNLAALPKLFEARSENAFCEFESSQPSQPVPSLWGVSCAQKYAGHSRALARRYAV